MNRLRAALTAHAGGLPATFWWLWAGAFVSSLANFVFPFLAVYLTARGFPPAQAGIIVSLFGAGILVAGPVAGALADRVGRRPTLLAALLGAAASAGALALVSSPAAIGPLVFLFGFSAASGRAPVQATIGDVVPLASRQRAFGLAYWAENIGIGVSLLAGGALASRGWALPFLADAATTLAFALVVLWRVPETRPPAAGRAGPAASVGYGPVLRDRTFTAFLGLHVLFATAFCQMQASLPIDMSRRGFSPGTFGAVLAVNAALIATLQPFAARLTGRWSPGVALAAGSSLVGLGYGAYALCSTARQYALATAAWSLGEIAYLPTAGALASTLAPPELRGRYAGALGLAFGAAFFVGPAAGPALLQAFGRGTLWCACLGVGAAVAVGQLALGRSAGFRERWSRAPAGAPPPARAEGAEAARRT